MQNKNTSEDFLKFLGTAGARFVMIKQLRASGGIWLNCQGTNVLIDPGPGSIVRCAASRPRLDPTKLDGIILTHRHLDHVNDVNVMIEAMTEGGFNKKGKVFCPKDALEEDTVILKYALGLPKEIVVLKERGSYQVGRFRFKTSCRHIHPVETYGLKFKIHKTAVSLLTDTKYFLGLSDFYGCDILIISVVFHQPRDGVDHLCLADAERLISEIKPEKTILTHFGMTMLAASPKQEAERLSRRLNRQILAAYDGMTLNFS